MWEKEHVERQGTGAARAARISGLGGSWYWVIHCQTAEQQTCKSLCIHLILGIEKSCGFWRGKNWVYNSGRNIHYSKGLAGPHQAAFVLLASGKERSKCIWVTRIKEGLKKAQTPQSSFWHPLLQRFHSSYLAPTLPVCSCPRRGIGCVDVELFQALLPSKKAPLLSLSIHISSLSAQLFTIPVPQQHLPLHSFHCYNSF